MPKRIAKPKLQKHTKTSIKMVLPLMALTVVTGMVLVFSSFAAGYYPSAYVNNLYSQAFGRAIDGPAASHLKSTFGSSGCNGTTLANTARAVFQSSEFARESYRNDGANGVIHRIYLGALRRNPDPSGYSYWLGKLNGGATRATVATGIINGSASAFNSLAGSVCTPPVQPPIVVTPVVTPTTPTKPKPTTPTKPKSTTPSTPAPAAPADTKAPSKPEEFEAEVNDDSSSVSLSWAGGSEEDGVATYKLERSTDGTTWTVIDDTITENSYEDRTVVFSTTYKYQIRAVDGTGNASESATTEVKTGEFNANASVEDATAIASEDNVVIASLPAGAVPGDSSCAVDLDSDNLTELKSALSVKQLRLAGPYLISCKDSNGDVVAGFSKAVTATMAPPSAATKGNTKFKIYVYDMQAEQWSLAKSTYDKKSKIYKVSIDGPSQVAFVGEKAPNYWPLIFSILIPTLLVGGGAFWYYQRKLKKQQYAEYIKKKYYNL
jgi:hypothetical protein